MTIAIKCNVIIFVSQGIFESSIRTCKTVLYQNMIIILLLSVFMGLRIAQSLSSTTPILKLNTHQGNIFTNATEYNELSLALGIFVHG